MITEQDVISILKPAAKPLKAREIAAILQRKSGSMITRSDVNQVLYPLLTRGVVSKDDEFRWTLGSKSSSSAAATPRTDPAATYYDILQVTKDAHPTVIMKAYKALVLLYHPDRAAVEERSEAEERMKLINLAYEVLSDSRKRADYDKSISS